MRNEEHLLPSGENPEGKSPEKQEPSFEASQAEPEKKESSPEDFVIAKEAQRIRDEEALGKVRENLGMKEEEGAAEAATQKKIEREKQEELKSSLNRLVGDLEGLENNLREGGFVLASFNIEDFRKTIDEEGVLDLKKVAETFNNLRTNLKKEILPREKSAPDVHRFNNVIDSLQTLNGSLVKLRRSMGSDELSENITRVMNAVRQKVESLEEGRNALSRYRAR